MSIQAYEKNPYQRSLDGEVLEIGRHPEPEGDCWWAVLAETVFYPEGGGQPADHGELGGVPVIDVRKIDGVIRHVLDGELEPGSARLELDWPRRFDHMQHHTAQHVLSAIAEDRFGLATTSFHLGALRCDVELDGAVDRRLAERLEEAVAEEIRSARSVRAFRIDPGELDRYQVRSRGLPAGFSGTVRLVEIDNVDLATCGGTHLRNTSEIEALTILDLEPRRGGTKVEFVVGGRLRCLLRRDEDLLCQLRRTLAVGDHELVAACDSHAREIKSLRQMLSKERTALAKAEGERLAALPDRLVVDDFPGRDVGFLRQVAASIRAPRAAILTGSSGDVAETTWLVISGGESDEELCACGDRAARVLGGRGGGKGIYQAKVASLDNLDEAIAIVRELLQ